MQRRIDDFLQYLETEKGCSENTISAYRNDLNQFVDFAAQQASSWDAIRKSNLVAYVRELRHRSYASSTVARKVAAVKSFFHFMLDQDILDDDPTATLDSPRSPSDCPRSCLRRKSRPCWTAPWTPKTRNPCATRPSSSFSMPAACGSASSSPST